MMNNWEKNVESESTSVPVTSHEILRQIRADKNMGRGDWKH